MTCLTEKEGENMADKKIQNLYRMIIFFVFVVFIIAVPVSAANNDEKRQALSEIMNSNPEDAEEPEYEKPAKSAKYEKDFE